MSLYKNEKIILYITTVTTITCLGYILATIIWAINRGFDFSDEGFYILQYQDHQQYFAVRSYFHVIIKSLFGWIDLNIFNTRLLRLVLTFLSSIFFSYGMIKFLTSFTFSPLIKIERLILYCFTLMGSFIGYTFGPQSLSYNHLNTVFISLSTGCVLLFLSKTSSNKKMHYGYPLLIIAGIFLGLNLFVKITSTLAFILIILFILLLLTAKIKRKLMTMLMFVTGIGISILVFFTMMQSYKEYVQVFKTMVQSSLSTSSSHAFVSIKKNIVDTLYFIITAFSFVLFWRFFMYLFFNHFKKFRIKQLPLILIISFFMIYLLFLNIKRLNVFFYSSIYLIFISISIIIHLFESIKQPAKKLYNTYSNKTILLILLLFVSPFLCALGTNNGLIVNAIFAVSFWYIAICALEIINSNIKKYISLLIVVASIVSAINFNKYFIHKPYGIKDLTLQTEKIINLKNAKGIRVDSETKNHVEEIDRILKANGYKSGDEIIGIFRLPGLIYLLEGYSPGGVLWSDEECELLIMSFTYHKKTANNIYFIVKDSYSDKFIEKINSIGLDFPSAYKCIGNVNYLFKTSIYAPMN